MRIMMQSDLDSLTRMLPRFTSSAPFAVTVGSNKKKFYIHSALLASLSEPLNRLVNGDFKEAQEAHVTLEHVDEETFSYFIQWAYTGKYHVLLPLVKSGGTGGSPAANASRSLFGNASPSPGAAATAGAGRIFGSAPLNPTTATTASATSSFSFGSAPLNPNTATTASATPSFSFGSAAATAAAGNSPSLLGSTSRAQGAATTNSATTGTGLFGSRPVNVGTDNHNAPAVPTQSGHEALWAQLTDLFKEPDAAFGSRATSTCYRFEPAALRASPLFKNDNEKGPNPLLVHARLFLLADYYDIKPLSDLSFREMGQTLLRKYKNPKSFEHSWQTEHVVELIELCWAEDSPAKLRDAVTLYVTCRIETLWDNEAFRKVVEETADLARVLIATVVQRLKSP